MGYFLYQTPLHARHLLLQVTTNFGLQGHLNNINVTVMQFSNGTDYRLVMVHREGKRKP